MRLLVLGGTRFLGRAVVDTALAAGWSVTTLTRGVSGAPPAGVDARTGDRTTAEGLAALAGDEWDLCIDTSGFVPRDVRLGAQALAGRVGHYVFVSTLNVYPDWPTVPVKLASATHDCAPDAGPDDGDYGVLKLGCERAVAEYFPGALTINRSGLLVGPHDNTGRLAWWLGRIAAGGEVLAPGDPDVAMGMIDVRDMAAWMLRRPDGTYLVAAPQGTQTYGGMLETCVEVTGSDATLRWVDDATLTAAGVESWTEMPLWADVETAGTLWDVEVQPAIDSGLTLRPFTETVADTWAAMRADGGPPVPNERGGRGIDPAKERAILAGLRA